ncbi:MAG: hypothetical protein A2Y62_03380 [Candidatus Fischerbacteria bacterium RBG_13_37_8]|uniref:Methyltransferase domain-containing protein n=1 Tax=Candidatus Fischerbacteria bacterium RBG_13_37_8 TaxID=1817863 RepID=A0A1F5VJT5_9BACT|nr:MAG: hypothetical protein A2Y62_03380 [Candidatus Fischerbacteria bacterium RBG_13_37_8]
MQLHVFNHVKNKKTTENTERRREFLKMKFPLYYQRVITESLRTYYPELGNNPVASPHLHKWIWELSEALRNENLYKQGMYYQQRELTAAYLAFLFPQSFMKINAILNELYSLNNTAFFEHDQYHIADIGCGIGASTFGTIEFFKAMKKDIVLHFDAIDYNKEPFELMREMSKDSNYFRNTNFAFIHNDIEKIASRSGRKCDIIILSLVLGEIESKISIIALIRKLMKHLTETGMLIIIEPALQESSKNLILLRNKLISYNVSILSPCLNEQPCPLTYSAQHWCYREIAWTPPASMEYLNRKLFREINTLKFSYLVIANNTRKGCRGGPMRPPNKIDANSDIPFQAEKELDLKNLYAFRAISFPKKQKGEYIIKACDSSCTIRVIELLHKDITDANKQFLELSRGDLFFLLDTALSEATIRLSSGTGIYNLQICKHLSPFIPRGSIK